MNTLALPPRLAAKLEIAPSGCWKWTASRDFGGYGRFYQDGKARRAHRVVYELLVGPIPEGLQLDHTCHDSTVCRDGTACTHRACVNPAHLEPVTQAENVARALLHNAVKTHCKRGHPLSGPNLYVKPATGDRICRTCSRAHQRAWKRRRSEAA